MSHLLNQLKEEKVHRSNLQALNQDMKTKFHDLAVENQKQEEEIRRLKNSNKRIHEPAKMENQPRSPPSSCRQLSTIGHHLNGIYLVANPDTNHVESVYCAFGTTSKLNYYNTLKKEYLSLN